MGGEKNAVRTLSSRGTAAADLRTNQLFVTDVPSKLEQVQQLIAKLDIPVKQVLIEARIVEATDTFGKSLGVKLGASDLRAQQGGDGGYSIGGGSRVAIGTSYANSVASSGAGGTVDTSGNFVNLPAVGSGAYAPATFALAISALESDGKGQVISSPRVVTADMKEASIETGTEVTISTGKDDKGNPINTVVKGVLGLKVTPRIMPDGSINMAIHVNKDTIVSRSPVEVSVKSVKTDILVDNGGTVVIGGIYESAETETLTKVPLLGDLPGVGNLFKNRSRSTDKRELLIFITPKVVADKAIR